MTRDQCAECGYEHFKHAIVCSRGLNPADHGISPAQLREKVETLEVRCAAIAATASIAIGTVSDRLDAALRRIEQLERDRAAIGQ